MANELETRVMRKVALRIVPFVMLLYFIAYAVGLYEGDLPRSHWELLERLRGR